MHKERFPKQRKSKLDTRGDGPFQVLEKINDNAYRILLLNKVQVFPSDHLARAANPIFSVW